MRAIPPSPVEPSSTRRQPKLPAPSSRRRRRVRSCCCSRRRRHTARSRTGAPLHRHRRSAGRARTGSCCSRRPASTGCRSSRTRDRPRSRLCRGSFRSSAIRPLRRRCCTRRPRWSQPQPNNSRRHRHTHSDSRRHRRRTPRSTGAHDRRRLRSPAQVRTDHSRCSNRPSRTACPWCSWWDSSPTSRCRGRAHTTALPRSRRRRCRRHSPLRRAQSSRRRTSLRRPSCSRTRRRRTGSGTDPGWSTRCPAPAEGHIDEPTCSSRRSRSPSRWCR
jgi:hypothetical protein